MKSELNKDNDIMSRKGLSELYKSKKEIKRKVDLLQDKDIKQKTMDFIFGKTDENPLSK